MIPSFKRSGLLPPGVHDCDWAEFATRYGEKRPGENPRRARLLRGLAALLLDLRRAGCRIVYVDGSFVTREKWPDDFDVCYAWDGMNGEHLEPVLRDFRGGRAAQKSRYGGEALPLDFPFDWGGSSILEAFQRDKRTAEAKGIVRLDLETNLAALQRFVATSESAKE